MIMLQVTGGVVLAYIIITNQQLVLKVLGWAVSCVIVCGLAFAILGGAWLAFDSWTESHPKALSRLGTALMALPVLGFAAAGGYGLYATICFLQGKAVPEVDGMTVVAWSVLNIALVFVISLPLLLFTPIGSLYFSIDEWSRANGYADGGAVGVAAVAWLWSMMPAFLLRRRRLSGGEVAMREGAPAD